MKSLTVLFNDNWKFCLTEADKIKDISRLAQERWYDVELPHDWLINDTRNLYRSGDGWYKKVFAVTAEQLSGSVFLNFDGVYMDSTVYVNGREAGSWTYGYSAFEFDITPLLRVGDNEVVVLVRYREPNTRWYSGAGIYRDVNLIVKPETYIPTNGIYIHSENKGEGAFETEVETDICGIAGEIYITLQVLSPKEEIIAGFEQRALFRGGRSGFVNRFTIDNPMLWDIDDPNVYTMRVSLYKDGELIDMDEESFGYKTAEFVPEKGLLLNGRQIKLHGVCMHHDLGALGAAFNFTALLRQLRTMKEMGANAIRTSHNMPVRQLMDICDHIGLLVDSEAFDMWENAKTEFDNHRFFKDTAERDVKSWVERDRNHPSLLMWSIGNEISDTNSEHGIEITKRLKGYVDKYDFKGNAPATIGSNFMSSLNAQKCSDELKLAGYNYAENLYESHHKTYPDWTIYGSETSSAVRSRAIYHFPADIPLLTHDDLQCSSLDNSVVGWGSFANKAWRLDRDCEFCAGQFVWTGFDYIGEPTPYSTKNSYFGIVDTAGFPKDIYYFYQSVWTDPAVNPMLHITPCYWDFNPGQPVDVIIYSNAEKVELFLNGRSLGVKEMRLADSEEMRAHFVVPYEAGELSAKGYCGKGEVIAEETLKTCLDPVKVTMESDKDALFADGRDIAFVEIFVADSNGTPVGNARNRIKVEVSGEARLVGLDNGDSTDYDSYKGDNRRLFGGKLLAMVQSTLKSGEIKVRAVSEGLQSAELTLNAAALPEGITADGVSVVKENAFPAAACEYTNEVPVRKIELTGGGELNENKTSAEIAVKLLPENAAYSDISWKVVRENGVESEIASVEPKEKGAVVTAIGDGEFYARAFVNNGGSVPQCFADVKFTVTGLGAATRDAYEFISACAADECLGAARVIEDGAMSAFEGRTVLVYHNIDFGSAGTDTIGISIGTCADVDIEVWEGTPDGGKLLLDSVFMGNGHWCGFAEQLFGLSERVKGLKTISFVIKNSGVIFGGFVFGAVNRAFDENFTAENDGVYGDEYTVSGRSIVGIGNNVIISYDGLDFGEKGAHYLTIKGATPNPMNAVQFRYTPKGGEQQSLFLDFISADSPEEQRFDIPALTGVNDIRFVFLPGSKFDFISFRFE